jgi:poly(hydroxyalkanoate) depolymerase family esterase
MVKRTVASVWANAFNRSAAKIAGGALRASSRATEHAMRAAIDRQRPPKGDGDWLAGMAVGLNGARRFRLYRPPGVKLGESLALMVMLHGCGQDAKSFAISTRMNRIAARERFLVLYPEQDRIANAQGCWNWFDTANGRAHGEAALIMKAIDQVCALYQVDPARIAMTGLSAGASMAALLVTRHPERFKALVMHSGVPPGAAHSTMSALGAMYGARAAKPLTSTPLTRFAPRPPLLVIHGGADHIVSAHNGQAAVSIWAEAAGARAGQKRTVQRGNRYPMTVTDFKCKGRTMATLVEIEKLGHAWSGGTAAQPFCDEKGPDASRMAWAFAAKQFRDLS